MALKGLLRFQFEPEKKSTPAHTPKFLSAPAAAVMEWNKEMLDR